MNELKTENYKFTQHKACEFFPCHDTSKPEEFNCLFCYCPLYALGDQCGGNFRYLDNGVKDCSSFMVPHVKDKGYDHVMGKFSEIMELAKKK